MPGKDGGYKRRLSEGGKQKDTEKETQLVDEPFKASRLRHWLLAQLGSSETTGGNKVRE
jgi:hypothetical protein